MPCVNPYRKTVKGPTRYIAVKSNLLYELQCCNDIIPMPNPSVLKMSMEALLTIKSGNEIIHDIGLPSHEIEGLCGLEPGALSFKETQPVVSLKYESKTSGL